MPTRDTILERFSSLSPTLQAAARFVVDRPNDVVTTSMRSLAERAGVQPATLVRLAQSLGFEGWPALKQSFVRDLGLHSERYGERAKHLTARGGDVDLLTELFLAHHRNLAATEARSAGALRQAAKLLKRARAVHIAGFRASFPIAYALMYGYRLFRNSVHLVDGLAAGLELQLRGIERQDTVVVFSFSPYSREAMQVVDAARHARARLVAFTDSSASPLALAADVSVLFSVDSPSFFPSISAAVASVEALLEILVAESGGDTIQRIEQAEQQLFDSGAYLLPPTKRQGGAN